AGGGAPAVGGADDRGFGRATRRRTAKERAERLLGRRIIARACRAGRGRNEREVRGHDERRLARYREFVGTVAAEEAVRSAGRQRRRGEGSGQDSGGPVHGTRRLMRPGRRWRPHRWAKRAPLAPVRD